MYTNIHGTTHCVTPIEFDDSLTFHYLFIYLFSEMLGSVSSANTFGTEINSSLMVNAKASN